MNLLNRYFAPFAALMILVAAKFNWDDETARQPIKISIAIWIASVAINWWLSNNTYRFVGWAGRLRLAQVWLNYLWAVPLFYLCGFWGPMWLLFVMAPVTASQNGGLGQTLLTAIVSSGTMLGLVWLRGYRLGLEVGEVAWAMAFVHATFIVFMSLFTYSLAQTALKLRDMSR